jgi:GT2 family glycosyltransferase
LPDNWNLLKKDLAECPVNTSGGCFWSANIMVERELFESMGGFDEQFLIAAQEDQDLQWRLQAHTRIEFVAAAQVVHPVRMKSLAKGIRECRMRANNHQKLVEKQANAAGRAFDARSHCAKAIQFQARVCFQQLRMFHFGHATIAFVTIFRSYLPQWLKLHFR